MRLGKCLGSKHLLLQCIQLVTLIRLCKVLLKYIHEFLAHFVYRHADRYFVSRIVRDDDVNIQVSIVMLPLYCTWTRVG